MRLLHGCAQSTASNVEQVANLMYVQANSVFYPLREWIVAYPVQPWVPLTAKDDYNHDKHDIKC